MPLLILVLFGAGAAAYYFLVMKQEEKDTPILPSPPVIPNDLGDILTPTDINNTTASLIQTSEPSPIIAFAETADLAGQPDSANVLRQRALEIIGYPNNFANLQTFLNSLHSNQIPLDVQYVIFEGLRQRTPESLQRAAFFAAQSGQQPLAEAIRLLYAGQVVGGTGEFTAQEFQTLVSSSQSSTDPQFKLWIADLLERFGMGTVAGNLRSQVLQSILAINPNSPVMGSMISVLQELPLSLQYLVMIDSVAKTPASIEQAADIIHVYAPTFEQAYRSIFTPQSVIQPI